MILAGYLALRFTGAKRSLPLFGAVWLSQLWGSSGLCAMAAVSGGAYAANSVVKFAFVLARAPPPWYGIARSPFVPPRPGCSWVLRGCKLLLFQ